MDLAISVIIVLIISLIKIINKEDNIIRVSYVTKDGDIGERTLKESQLIVGNNLMLRRETRAYHKILDEMGLK